MPNEPSANATSSSAAARWRPAAARIAVSPTWLPTWTPTPALAAPPGDRQRAREAAALGDADVEEVHGLLGDQRLGVVHASPATRRPSAARWRRLAPRAYADAGPRGSGCSTAAIPSGSTASGPPTARSKRPAAVGVEPQRDVGAERLAHGGHARDVVVGSPTLTLTWRRPTARIYRACWTARSDGAGRDDAAVDDARAPRRQHRRRAGGRRARSAQSRTASSSAARAACGAITPGRRASGTNASSSARSSAARAAHAPPPAATGRGRGDRASSRPSRPVT